jgi:hypothetical protein
MSLFRNFMLHADQWLRQPVPVWQCRHLFGVRIVLLRWRTIYIRR